MVLARFLSVPYAYQAYPTLMARTLIVHYDSFLSGPLANRFVCSIIYFDFAIDTLVCHISALIRRIAA